MRILVVIMLAILFSTTCFAGDVNIVDVVDGDTLLLETNGVVAHYAIYGVDAPENGQKYGNDARNFVHNKITTGEYKVDVKNISAGKISYVTVYLTDEGNDLSCLIIYNGLAFYDRKLDKNKKENEKYTNSEKYARDSKKGVWAEALIEYPWEYRTVNKILENEEIEGNKRLSDYALALSKSGDASSSSYKNYYECYNAELDIVAKKLGNHSPLGVLAGLQQAKVNVAYYCASIFGGDVKVRTIQTYNPANDKLGEIEKKLDDIEHRQKYGN